MSSPRNWQKVKLAELLTQERREVTVDPVKEYALLGAHWYARGLYVKETKLGSQIKASKLYRVEEGDFVYNRLFAWKGSFAVATEENAGCFVSNEFPYFHANKDRVHPIFLWRYFSREPAWNEALGLSFGATPTSRNRLKETNLLSMEIPLPPLSEQQRIVEKIGWLAAKIADASRLRNQSVTETDIFSHNVSRAVFHDTGKFARVNLDEVCLDIIDCLHSNPVYCEDGIPTVRSPDVGWGRLFLETARRTTYEEYGRRTRRGKPRPGDIILVREGGGTGKAGIVEEGQQLSLGQRVMQLRPNEKKVLPRYLLHQWLSPLIQEDQIAAMMKGSASPHLNIGSLKKFQVVIPPLEEQRRIVDYLDGFQSKLERLKKLQAQTAAELDALLPSILDKAFRGDL